MAGSKSELTTWIRIRPLDLQKHQNLKVIIIDIWYMRKWLLLQVFFYFSWGFIQGFSLRLCRLRKKNSLVCLQDKIRMRISKILWSGSIIFFSYHDLKIVVVNTDPHESGTIWILNCSNGSDPAKSERADKLNKNLIWMWILDCVYWRDCSM